MALGSQLVAYRLPTKWLWGGFGWLSRPNTRKAFSGMEVQPQQSPSLVFILDSDYDDANDDEADEELGLPGPGIEAP